MSDYIYGSSLRAAKSKANYLFEGDFRRRPNQNLSGASRSVARVELLQQAAEQRQSREDTRRKANATLKIQSVWRSYICRKEYALSMRKTFDSVIEKIKSNTSFDEKTFDKLSHEFIIFFHRQKDEQRFDILIDLMMTHQTIIIRSKNREPKVWLHRVMKLLKINLGIIEKYSSSSKSRYMQFFEYFTRPNETLDESEAAVVWRTLVDCGMYSIMRQLAEMNSNKCSETKFDNPQSQLIVELIRRSLDSEAHENFNDKPMPAYSFFSQFLHGPLSPLLDTYYFHVLLGLQPEQLKPKHLLKAFISSHKLIKDRLRFTPSNNSTNFGIDLASVGDIQECKNTIWLSYSFIRALYTQVDHLNDIEKVNYINIISILLAPAEYITNISLIQAANSECDDQSDDLPDEINTSSSKTHQLTQYHKDIHHVITKLIEFINELEHINGLKSIIFNCDLQPQVQGAIVQICNLMLTHEYLAIFNCRLLYTVAFSKEFSRSLWKSIMTTTSTTLYGTSVPVLVQISRGNNISHESWRLILPKLRLFCSLCSYLLPTLDDEEFYTNDDNTMFVDGNNGENQTEERLNQVKRDSETTSSGFYVDKELVGISATLRDICIGLIEILYQGNRNSTSNQNFGSRFDSGFQDEQTKLLSFEIKSCFQALVRLVCQLHARDSRKQFCPDGHWMSPSVIIPANKAVDFQLVTSQQGRLLNQITKDDKNSIDRLASVSSEIKTVLILQEIPFVISFHDRVQIFHQLLRKDRQIHQSDGYHFGLPGMAIQVQIRRNYIYEDAFERLSVENEPNMKLPLKVSLINAVGADEAGIDGGGLSKEFLGELLKAGFDPMRGFFKYTKDHLLYPNPSANVLFANFPEGYEVHYEFLGRMLGKAIFEKIMVELPLATFFLAKLLAVKHSSDVDLHNLQSLDPVLYKNLVYLKNYKGDVADLNLDFTISNNDLGEHEVLELKPGGSKIPVTRENKIEYVHLVADYRLNKQIRLQCAAFKRGLAQLIDLDWLRMFDPRELQILISGAPTVIDVADWRRHTIYGNGYSDTCEAIQTFWNVVNGFDENQKRKLLKFATSCSLPPLLGFKDLVPQFSIAPAEEERLPTASTCMNLLKLPECEDEMTMRSKLLYAIESNSGFELS